MSSFYITPLLNPCCCCGCWSCSSFPTVSGCYGDDDNVLISTITPPAIVPAASFHTATVNDTLPRFQSRNSNCYYLTTPKESERPQDYLWIYHCDVSTWRCCGNSRRERGRGNRSTRVCLCVITLSSRLVQHQTRCIRFEEISKSKHFHQRIRNKRRKSGKSNLTNISPTHIICSSESLFFKQKRYQAKAGGALIFLLLSLSLSLSLMSVFICAVSVSSLQRI